MWSIAILTRPIALYLPLVVVAMFLFRHGRLAVLAAFSIAALLAPGTWIVRNYLRSGVATLSSIEGENLLLYRAGGAIVVADKSPQAAVFALQKQFGFYREALHIRRPLLEEAWRDAAAEGHHLDTANHAQLSRYYASVSDSEAVETSIGVPRRSRPAPSFRCSSTISPESRPGKECTWTRRAWC